ncbi:MAG: type II toxin-antitoxin system HicB family antitoxin [Candidatus Riflebacteria bacterium]|nr:type II toxin-antitoxin system HicB family antitoxin [Candidatus Riflebacteria bacterium]
MNYEYPFTITPDGDGFLVQFVDIEEAFTCGDSIEESIFNAEEVLTAMLECRMEDGKPIPEPSQGDWKYKVAPSAAVQSALLVRKAREDKTLAELARAMGTSWPAVQKLEDPKHYPSLRQLEKAVNSLGKRLVLSITD